MDSTGNERWQTKLAQHRELRKSLYDPRRHPADVYAKVTEYNGKLVHDWINIFHNSWRRERPIAPALQAEIEKKAIASIITKEKEAITIDLLSLWEAGNLTEIKAGEKYLRESCHVLQAKCFEEIENDCAIRVSEMEKERDDKYEKRKDLIYQLFSGAFIAILSVMLTNWFNKGDAQMIQNEIVQLRKEYHQLVIWTLKSVAQIDTEISRRASDLALRKAKIHSAYIKKTQIYVNDMANRGVLDSGMTKIGLEKLKNEEREEIQSIEMDTKREIEDLTSKKRQLNEK